MLGVIIWTGDNDKNAIVMGLDQKELFLFPEEHYLSLEHSQPCIGDIVSYELTGGQGSRPTKTRIVRDWAILQADEVQENPQVLVQAVTQLDQMPRVARARRTT